MEIADSITEIKTVCSCGRKATVNVRLDENSKIVTEGEPNNAPTYSLGTNDDV